MVRIEEHKAEIENYTRLAAILPPGPVRNDVVRHLHQLQKDLAECMMYLKRGTANASNRA